MTLQVKPSTRSSGSYHFNNSLLFQFILSDFLGAYLEFQSLDILCNRKPLPIQEQAYTQHNQDLIQDISIILEKLVGVKHDFNKRFSSSFQEGILNKVKTHCTIFSQQADSEEKELLAMQHYADKIWQNCMLAVDALGEAPGKCVRLLSYLEKASNAMQRLSKLIARVIFQFRDDENVMFFILRHHNEFDKVFGKRFSYKIFCRMYPKGTREAEHFLIKKYMDRSFDNILPVIARLFKELEASNL